MTSITSNPQVFTSEARYAFGQGHDVDIKLLCGEQWRDAEAVDVSKSHICVLTQPCELLFEGAACGELTVNLNGQQFSLNSLRVSKSTLAEDGRQQRILLSNEDVDSEQGQENSRLLWQISYALRQLPVKAEAPRYDEFNLPKVPARGL